MFWFFKKKNAPLPGSIAEEEWKESFSLFSKSRFRNETAENYNSSVIPGTGLFLSIKKENIFAWCEPQDIRYYDFDAECAFSFKTEKAYCSGGLLFRMGNDYNYYYFLVSNKGYFRVDCVFNGNPLMLIGWTPLSFPLEQVNTLRVTAWGSSFLFFVNGIHVAKLSDETISGGAVTFCGQNYGEAAEASLLLKKFRINSIPYEVEKIYSENSIIPDPQKLVLAKSFFNKGQFLPAAVQMKSYLKSLGPDMQSDGLLGFYGEILLNLGMYEDALDQFDRALEKNNKERNYLLEKGNILYQLGRYKDLGTYLSQTEPLLAGEPLYWNLCGHSRLYLGNAFDASVCYKKAAALDADNPVYHLNAAKSLESAGDESGSAFYYAESSRLFFRQENYAEAEDSAHLALRKVPPESDTALKAESVLARILFYNNKHKKAEEKFKKLINLNADKCGSEIFFLYGLLLRERGKNSKAVDMIRKACEKESDYYLYWYKLAEISRLTGADAAGPLAKAYELSPDDCWVNNLLGTIALDNNNPESAEKHLEKAYTAGTASGEVIPAINYSEALLLNRKTEKALAVIESAAPDASVFMQKGRIYEYSGNYEAAGEAYRAVLGLDPGNTAAVKALITLYFRIDEYGKAEELLSSIDDSAFDSDILNMAGNIARVRGNFDAAFDAYRKSLAMEFNPVVALNYVEGLCESCDYFRAEENFKKYFSQESESGSDPVEGLKPGDSLRERKEMLWKRIVRETTATIECALCSRKWIVSKNVKTVKTLKITGEPGPESPAGKCRVCGKVYCVGCASSWIRDGRFFCPECGENLKLSDDYLRYLAALSLDS